MQPNMSQCYAMAEKMLLDGFKFRRRAAINAISKFVKVQQETEAAQICNDKFDECE